MHKLAAEDDPMNAQPAPKLSLRERKFARTKLGLLRAALERIEQRPLDEISVKELCGAAEVSEATFFNYFPRKADILTYFTQLWSLEIAWQLAHTVQSRDGVDAIAEIFRFAARKIQEQPGTIGEVIAFQARNRDRHRPPEPGRAERLLAFPDHAGIERFAADGMDQLFARHLQYAIEHGQLPANTHLRSAMIGLVSIFYGVPLTLAQTTPQAIGSAYQYQLTVLWAGIRAAAGT